MLRLLIMGVLIAFVLLFVWTQLLVPAWNNKPLFPMFRKKLVALEKQRNELHAQLEEKELQEEIEELKKEVAGVKDPNKDV